MPKSKKYFMLDLVHFPFAKKSSRAMAQRLRLIAETTIKAQLINWFPAVAIKSLSKAFVLTTHTPKKSRNMSRIFC
jgi:hypothetical protein